MSVHRVLDHQLVQAVALGDPVHLTFVRGVQSEPDESFAALTYLADRGRMRVLARQSYPVDVDGTVDDGASGGDGDLRTDGVSAVRRSQRVQ
jgi:hypothetical protein